ncbi:MAG TPA: LysM domain-containing protein, partial [Anaerolineales bacterium]|nr:LysM domain-containing protein [Anaerolineales bacterium]
MLKRFLLLFAVVSLLVIVRPVSAQSSGPVYIVQPGDTLSSIAARFNISLADLMNANGITNPNVLDVG